MTHLHHTPTATERWLASDAARHEFADWAAYVTDDTEFRDMIAWPLTGWAPTWELVQAIHHQDREPLADWVAMHPNHPGVRWLFDLIHPEWIGTDHEHERFHSWARSIGEPDALCGGCWA